MKNTKKIDGLCGGLIAVIFFFLGPISVFADVTNNLSVPISPNGDVPAITVACTVGHAYTEALYNNSLMGMLGSYYGLSGGTFRKYCETGSITFAGWNMNTLLDSYGGVGSEDTWALYIRTPFKYVIIDSTNEGGCNSTNDCAQYGLVSAWEGYRNGIYKPSTTCYNTEYDENACTLAAGPIWTTTPYTHVWSDPRDLIPVPPPVGDPHNLPAIISANSDVPAISIACTPGHDYTLSLVHQENGVVTHSFGVVQRVWCYPGVHNNIIAFNGFNLQSLLETRIDPSWWNYMQTPLEYIIKDTTGVFDCDDEYCPLTGLDNSFNNFDHNVYLASSTYWPTVGVGPIFDTHDHGATWFNANVIATSTPPTGNSNVLFLPGLEASRLYMQTPSKCPLNCEDQLWEPNTNTDAQALYLNPDGTSKNSGIYTRDILKTTNTPLSLGIFNQNIYKSFSDMMDGLVSSGKINAWKPFAYDWRQSVQDIVNNGTAYQGTTTSVIATLQTLVNSSKNGKVTIVAHSNGGLLAKTLLKKLEDDKAAGKNSLIDHIDTVILVASPQLGTPTAISGLLHGYDQDINPLLVWPFITSATARSLGVNMPSAYGLLPSAEYFNHVSNPVISFVPNILDPYISKDISTYTNQITNYAKEKGFVLGIEGRNDPGVLDILQPIKGNSALLTQAEALHSSIDTLTVPANIRVVQIAGWGVDTISGFQYDTTVPCSVTTDNGCTGKYILDEKPIFTSDGDKTVVTPSALAMVGEKWWVNLLKTKNVHKNILEVQPVLSLISNTITKDHTTSSIYLSTTTPIDTSSRLRLSVHSPVSIGAYDNLGNFTGKVCDDFGNCIVMENIPNSGYYEFGEGKYINLPQDQLQKITLQGTDIGTFTFDYQIVTPSDQTTTSSFNDIPVTTQTQATITANPTTQTPQLALDITGDGVTDFTLTPSITFDPITYLQVMKATIDSLDLTDAKKKAFDNRVDNIIKSIQKGKVDKAKLKADKFKTVLQNKLAKPDPKKPKLKKLSKTDAQTLLDLLNGLLDNLS